MRPVPTGKNVTDPLDDYDDRYRVCRGEQHAFPYGSRDDHWDEEFGEGERLIGYRRVLICPRCKATDTDRYDLSGNFTRYRRYPKGYKISRTEHGYIGKGRVRLSRLPAAARRAS